MKYFLFGVLCTIVCKSLFPYPTGDFGRQEIVQDRQTPKTGNDGVQPYPPISRIEAKKYIAFPDILIWENEETDDEDETVEGLGEKAVHEGLYTNRVANSPALHFRLSLIPLFILFHSWKHFLS